MGKRHLGMTNEEMLKLALERIGVISINRVINVGNNVDEDFDLISDIVKECFDSLHE